MIETSTRVLVNGTVKVRIGKQTHTLANGAEAEAFKHGARLAAAEFANAIAAFQERTA